MADHVRYGLRSQHPAGDQTAMVVADKMLVKMASKTGSKIGNQQAKRSPEIRAGGWVGGSQP